MRNNKQRKGPQVLRKAIIIFSIFIITACSNVPNEPIYQASNTTLPIGQQSFNEYVHGTRVWLMKNRAFLSKDTSAEIKANSPYELMPTVKLAKSRGILLVHGLLDSPYSFVDIAPMLANMGFRVRTVLLEGHGSKPADLLNADFDHWRDLVEQQTQIFKREVDELYLGGFSTGANLVTSHALKDPDIQGLLLFSPGFEAKNDMVRLTPFLSLFRDWVYTPSMKSQTNYVRYRTAPSNAFAQFYHTSSDIMHRLKRQQYDKPVFIAVSGADSIVNVNLALKLFSSRMINPKSRLIWFGDKPHSTDERVTVLAGKVPKFKVSNFSHMGLLFDSKNGYYGSNGSQRICNNGQQAEAYFRCVKRQEVWYSAYGYREADKAHARLTFNPWFDEMRKVIREVMLAD